MLCRLLLYAQELFEKPIFKPNSLGGYIRFVSTFPSFINETFNFFAFSLLLLLLKLESHETLQAVHSCRLASTGYSAWKHSWPLSIHGMMFQFQTLSSLRWPKFVDDINFSYCQVKICNLKKHIPEFLFVPFKSLAQKSTWEGLFCPHSWPTNDNIHCITFFYLPCSKAK